MLFNGWEVGRYRHKGVPIIEADRGVLWERGPSSDLSHPLCENLCRAHLYWGTSLWGKELARGSCTGVGDPSVLGGRTRLYNGDHFCFGAPSLQCMPLYTWVGSAHCKYSPGCRPHKDNFLWLLAFMPLTWNVFETLWVKHQIPNNLCQLRSHKMWFEINIKKKS